SRDESTLVAYLIASIPANSQDTSPVQAEIREYLRHRLPEHMVPSALIQMEELPLTASGKIDRRALPASRREQRDTMQTLLMPRTISEQLLANIWISVLGIERIGVQDDFFAVGGHSLLAIHLISQMQKQSGRSIPLTMLFQARTIE